MMQSFLRRSLVLAVALAFTAPVAAADDELERQYSYVLGQQLGNRVSSQDIDVDADALADGLRDAVAGNQSRYSEAETREIMSRWRQRQAEARAEAGKAAQARGDQWLAENGKRDGVTTTDSGLQYEVIEAAPAEAKGPDSGSTVIVHYRGTLIDGTEFDSSWSRNKPATFVVGQVIQGWQQALQLMRAGDKWKVAIPSNLAYGQRGAPPKIGPNETLLFEIDLIEVR